MIRDHSVCLAGGFLFTARSAAARWCGVVLLALSGVAAQAGLINVELAPAAQTVNLGDTVNVELRAVSADGNNQSVGVMGVVLHWNPTAFTLLGNNDNGPFSWTSSGFTAGNGGLNDDLTDGDAYYQAVA